MSNDKVLIDKPYKIIEDREKAIIRKADYKSSPSNAVIEFRQDIRDKFQRPIVLVPIDLLRFRIQNKRLRSNIISYKKRGDGIDLDTGDQDRVQDIIQKMLFEKDKSATKDLIAGLEKDGQRREAVITCDGFLIDGNRRLAVLKHLYDRTRDPRFSRMNVVILPGNSKNNDIGESVRIDSGGPPSEKEILKIEKERQFSREGKSEFTNLDKAISIREELEFFDSKEDYIKNENSGVKYSLKKELKTINDTYLGPLEQVDMYLKWKNKDQEYDTISNKWNALRDIHIHMWSKYYPREIAIENQLDPDDAIPLQEILFNVVEMGKEPTSDGRKMTGDTKDAIRSVVKNFQNDPIARKEYKTLLKINLMDEASDEEDEIIKPTIEDINEGEIHDVPVIKKPEIKKPSIKKPINPKSKEKKKEKIKNILLNVQDRADQQNEKGNATKYLQAALDKLLNGKIVIDIVDNTEELEDIIASCDEITDKVSELRDQAVNRKNYRIKKKEKYVKEKSSSSKRK